MFIHIYIYIYTHSYMLAQVYRYPKFSQVGGNKRRWCCIQCTTLQCDATYHVLGATIRIARAIELPLKHTATYCNRDSLQHNATHCNRSPPFSHICATIRVARTIKLPLNHRPRSDRSNASLLPSLSTGNGRLPNQRH